MTLTPFKWYIYIRPEIIFTGQNHSQSSEDSSLIAQGKHVFPKCQYGAVNDRLCKGNKTHSRDKMSRKAHLADVTPVCRMPGAVSM